MYYIGTFAIKNKNILYITRTAGCSWRKVIAISKREYFFYARRRGGRLEYIDLFDQKNKKTPNN